MILKRNVLEIIFLMGLAIIANTIIYFSYGNLYSAKIFNHQSFSQQFQSGIYQYRLLSGYFLFWIYDFLGQFSFDYSVLMLKFFNKNAEPQMYVAFYLLNTFFLMASAIALKMLFDLKQVIATSTEKLLLSVVAILTIAISQFVILPYDFSSYFFLLVFALVFLSYVEQKSDLKLFMLSILIIISTLNRESSALSLSLAATLLYAKYGIKKESIFPIAILGLSFLATYLGIRVLSDGFVTNDGNLLMKNFKQTKNLLGIIFWIVFFAFSMLLAKDKRTQKNILRFHLFSLPYILMCFYTGILYEMRLYIPLFLSALLLSRIEISPLRLVK